MAPPARDDLPPWLEQAGCSWYSQCRETPEEPGETQEKPRRSALSQRSSPDLFGRTGRATESPLSAALPNCGQSERRCADSGDKTPDRYSPRPHARVCLDCMLTSEWRDERRMMDVFGEGERQGGRCG
eukprot:gene15619-biopygen2836